MQNTVKLEKRSLSLIEKKETMQIKDSLVDSVLKAKLWIKDCFSSSVVAVFQIASKKWSLSLNWEEG